MEISQRQRDAEAIVHMNYGQAYGKALDAQASRDTPQANKIAAAAMLAEQSATANRDPQIINRAEASAGRAAMEQTYGSRQAQDATAVLSGRVVDYDLPKGFGGTKDLAALVEKGQKLVENVNQDSYASRGRVSAFGHNGNYMEQVAGKEIESKDKLAGHMLHVKASIDAAVDRKQFDRQQADSLYQRFEKSVFDPEAQKKGSKDFADYATAQTPRIQQETSRDVDARYGAQSKTIDRAKGKEIDPVNASRADAFRNLPTADALKKHPELAGAVAAMSAVAKQAEAHGLNEQQRAAVMNQARNNMAKTIEQGQIPEVKVRDTLEIKQDKVTER